MQLLSVGIADQSGAIVEAAQRDRPLAVRTRFLVRERVRGLDIKISITMRLGIRALEENLSDQDPATDCGSAPGEWEATIVLPPVLAAGDYVLGIAMRSPYQRFLDEALLTFQLWSPPDERRESIDRNRIVQPGATLRRQAPRPPGTVDPS